MSSDQREVQPTPPIPYGSTFKRQLYDPDPEETREWVESLDAVLAARGPQRARFLLHTVLKRARMLNLGMELVQTPYINTISPEQEPPFPGDEAMEKRIRRIVRWNAMAMVTRANTRFAGLGGHLSTYASAAALYEVGFNHFFRAGDGDGDQIFYQGHAAPGIYSRMFLEGRLNEQHLDAFRRETTGHGLPSYPHPRRLPDVWEFPTVSMGLGPLNAIYQARFNRYLLHRGLKDTSRSRVWAFVGDGETDEPEALGALHVAANERLDNLIFVVNCNLQRLDGPVRGNGKIIQELEAKFRGSGWNVIKVVLGREWDALLARDEEGLLLDRLNTVVDGWWQRYHVEGGAFMRQHFFGTHPKLLQLVQHLSDDQIWNLKFGGHDYRKLYAAFRLATQPNGRPTAILVKTVKGWTLGREFQGTNPTHQLKKLNVAQLKAFRDVLHLPIADAALEEGIPPYYHPGEASPEVEYLRARRAALGGVLPARRVQVSVPQLPESTLYDEFLAGSGGREVSTTMAFVSLLRKLVKHRELGPRIVPIVPDEARTFGMHGLFSDVGIYASQGQKYEPADHKLILRYQEQQDGQILEEGITEAGSMASFTAAGTAYATHSLFMLPFYIFYSMFGFQRVGDLVWAFGDAKGRGFLIGATAGRTTLHGEGLQHNDGHSHVLFSVMPNVRAYDPAFAYELAVLIRDGIERMARHQEDVFYYLTVYNENYPMPPMPPGAEEGIVRGLYRLRRADVEAPRRAQLLGSGPILREVLRAADLLALRGVAADVWSATSFQQLRADALACERYNRLHPGEPPRIPYVTAQLADTQGPIIAATDYMKAVPDMVARWIPRDYTVLGSDGYGLSDTRPALRRHFEVDAEHVVVATLTALARMGQGEPAEAARAIAEFGIDPEAPDPVTL